MENWKSLDLVEKFLFGMLGWLLFCMFLLCNVVMFQIIKYTFF